MRIRLVLIVIDKPTHISDNMTLYKEIEWKRMNERVQFFKNSQWMAIICCIACVVYMFPSLFRMPCMTNPCLHCTYNVCEISFAMDDTIYFVYGIAFQSMHMILEFHTYSWIFFRRER